MLLVRKFQATKSQFLQKYRLVLGECFLVLPGIADKRALTSDYSLQRLCLNLFKCLFQKTFLPRAPSPCDYIQLEFMRSLSI